MERYFKRNKERMTLAGDAKHIDPQVPGLLADGWVEVPSMADLPVFVPTVVTMRQARLALLQRGLLSQVKTAVANSGQAAQIEWATSNTVERNRAFVQSIATGLGLTDAQLDDLFRLAATL